VNEGVHFVGVVVEDFHVLCEFVECLLLLLGGEFFWVVGGWGFADQEVGCEEQEGHEHEQCQCGGGDACECGPGGWSFGGLVRLGGG